MLFIIQCRQRKVHVKKFTAKADSMGLSNAKSPLQGRKSGLRESMSDNFKERIIQSNPVYAAMIYSVDENIGKLMARA